MRGSSTIWPDDQYDTRVACSVCEDGSRPRLDLDGLIDVNDHILGPMHAPVVVVEYGDFECPTCKQAAPAVKLLLERLSTRRLSGYAARLGLDMARYETEMRDHVYLQKIREHQDCARRSHVRGTPGFFVNGRIQDVTFGLRALFDAVTRAIAQHR